MSSIRVETETGKANDNSSGNYAVNRLLTRLEPIFLVVSLALILVGTVVHNNILLTDGVGVLIATPVVVVAASTFAFARQHDYRFVIVGVVVLATILLSALGQLKN